jgi:hypothetical protein
MSNILEYYAAKKCIHAKLRADQTFFRGMLDTI